MSISSLINANGESCIIERESVGFDGIGAAVSSWSTVTTSQIWLQPLSTNETLEFEKRGIKITHKAYTYADNVAKEGDRITTDNKAYIIAGKKNHAGMDQMWSFVLREVI